ncbi:MAG: DUF2945 domain-containing protein [Phycisphaerales bacterium]
MIREGTKVRWKWGDGYATGIVVQRSEQEISRTIDGSTVSRDGSSDDPALVIEQDDGQTVLKLDSEVERAD